MTAPYLLGTITKCVYQDGRIECGDNVKDVALYIEKVDEMIQRKRKLLGCIEYIMTRQAALHVSKDVGAVLFLLNDISTCIILR